MQTTIFIACKDYKRRKEIALTIMSNTNHLIIGESACGKVALQNITEHSPSICFVDINITGLDGISIAEKTKKLKSFTKLVLIPEYPDENLLRSALELGVKGFSFLKKKYQVLECIDALNDGEYYIDTELYHAHYFSSVG